MALVLNDRVKETSVTTGTGTLTLDGAVQGFETFSSSIGNTNTSFYAIELPGTTEFEVGRGTISAGQLARTEIISSSNSDSAVDFSAGTKIVFCTLPASKFVPGKFEGANFADSILIGHSDSGTLSSAEDNTGVGIVALDALTSGDQNTAVGNEAGSGITSSGKNTGVGAFALNVVTDSTGFNSAFGRSALQLVTGSYNTGVGAGAGENITSGDGNVIIGKVLADSATGDRQLKISGHDGSTTTTWISGDNTGALTFADKVVLAANKTIEFGDSGETISGDGTDLTITSSNDLDLVSNGTGTQSTLITSAGGIYLDSAETNRIDAATGILNFYKAGTLGISLNIDGNNDTVLHSRHNDKDIKFDGQDGGSTITALTLDMSAAGNATFNNNIMIAQDAGSTTGKILLGAAVDGEQGDLEVYHDGNHSHIRNRSSGDLRLRSGVLKLLSDSSTYLTATLAGSVDLYHDNSKKFETTSAGATVTGALTADGGLKADNITIDGTEIDLSSGDLTIDVAGKIILDGDTDGIEFHDGGTKFASFSNSSGNAILAVSQQDKDLTIILNDGGSSINAVAFDASLAGNAFFNGTVTANAGLIADNITIDGTEIDLSSGDLTLDVAGDIILNADGGDWIFRDDTTELLKIFNNSSNVSIKAQVQDKDLSFLGNDGGSGITALTLDMSEAGAATFNDKIILGANKSIEFGDSGETITGDGTAITVASSEDITLDAASEINLDAGSDSIRIKDDGTEYGRIHRVSGGGLILKSQESDKDIQFQGVDGGSSVTALTLDMSEGGIATFNDDIIIKDNGTIGTSSTPAQMTLDSGGKVTFVNHVALNGDLFLQHDEAQIQLGAGQDIRIIHDADDGLVFKNTSTGDDKPFILTLQTGETDIAANDVLGKIDFQAPDEGTGTDAILVAAGIEAVSEGDFSSSSNATKLSFKTAASEAASEKMSLSSAGNLTVTGTVTANGEVLTAGVSAGFAVAMAIAL